MMAMFSKHFTVAELECPTAKIIKLQPGFIERLEELREAYGRPMKVNSACRTMEHNEWLIKRGYKASPNSFHLIGNEKYKTDTCAVDIARPAGEALIDLIGYAINLGWTIGFARTFVHLDLRTDFAGLPQVFYDYS